MVIPLHAQVTGFKVENVWRRKAYSSVRCTARLSRRLRAAEIERVEQLPDTVVERTEVVHDCGPEEIEHWHTRLVEALMGTRPEKPGRVAVGEKKSRRTLRKAPSRTPQPEPAA
jgi:hypothetical protein